MPDNDLDIAIVGGGISGLYAAWRLASASPSRRIGLFEGSNRLGGRLDTVRIPVNEPSCSVELGAMRFTSCMSLVTSLFQHLGIQTEKFPGCSLHQLYFRGLSVAVDQSGAPIGQIPYRLGSGEPSNPFQLALQIIQQGVPGAMKLTTAEWDNVVKNGTFQGRPLSNWGFWDMAEQMISNEAYQFLVASMGLESVLGNSNAALGLRQMALVLRDYEQGNVFRPSNGWSSVPDAIGKSVASAPHCHVQMDHQLLEARKGSGGIELLFATDDGSVQVSAGSVILALPRRPLDLLHLQGLFPANSYRLELATEFTGKLASVEQIPAFKLCVLYSAPWWQQAKGWSDGYSVTDLPLRQVFYGVGQGGQQSANERVLMSTYCDSQSAQFWSGMANLGPNRTISSQNGDFSEPRVQRLMKAVDRQLRELLQITQDLPNPLWVGYMDWSKDPFGAAWHEWLPGVDVMKAIREMRQPVPGVPVYICGEAYSYFQGWVEGALASVEHVLQNNLGLAWPDWLSRTCDLGP